jgi:hypothetical protein
MFTNFYIQKQPTKKCSKHFHVRDQAYPVWIKLIYNIHTALINTTPKIKHLSTNKAYFYSIIPFCLTFSMLLMNLLLKILNSSYVLSLALAWVWRWRSMKMAIMLGSHQNFGVSWTNAEGRPLTVGSYDYKAFCVVCTQNGRVISTKVFVTHTTLTSLYLNMLYWHLLTLPYNRHTGQNCPLKCTSLSSETENNALLQWLFKWNSALPTAEMLHVADIHLWLNIIYIYIKN